MNRALAVPVAAALLLSTLGFAAAPRAGAQAFASSRWWDDVDRVDEMLRAGRWAKAERRAEGLIREVVRESWREPDLGQVLAELSLQAAVAHANRGDEEEALWHWYAAQAHERAAGRIRGGPRLLERDLAPYGAAAELLPAHPLRRLGEVPAGEVEVELDPLVDYRPVTPPAVGQLPLENKSVTRERPAPVVFEVFVDREGHLRQPVVKTDWAHPVVIQWGLDNLHEMPRFGPATIDGEPVGMLEEIELDLGAARKF